jgi:predicted dehydrogenase
VPSPGGSARQTAAVVGLGSAGRRHVSVIRRCLPECRVIGVRRPDSAPSSLVDVNVHDIDHALAQRPSFAVIAGPSPMRLAAARPFIDARVPVLLEKPIASSPEDARELRHLARRSGVVAAVGYNLRHHRPVEHLCQIVAEGRIGTMLSLRATAGQHLAQWRPDVDYRTTVSALPAAGGGALLELSHELDLALRLGGAVSAVTSQTRSISDLHLQVEDSADLLLSFTSHAVANIHLDLFDRVPARELNVVGTRGSVRLDVIAGALTLDVGERHDRHVYPDVIADSYERQLRTFLAHVDAERADEGPLDTAVAVVEVVHAAKQAAATGRTVPLDAVTEAEMAAR